MDKPVTIDTILISSGKRLEKSRDMIIRLLQENPSLSASVLAEKIGITQRIVERHISKLKAEGILFRDRADNGGCWVILSNDKKDV
ncbi:MAG: winged helix-turn-helix transcriptional regulator [Lentisphaeria bacterium]|nr:winged helix-turn-helix transcriptional regulator [Lentisphaeria bacterium]